MCCRHKDYSFSDMGNPNHIWAIPSIHADIDRLFSIHDVIFEKIRPGDRLIYLGNYTGYGSYARETIDEILMFRRLLLAQPAMKATDIIYLKGFQENLWQRLYQLPYNLFPVEELLDIMSNGLGKTMDSYGICPHQGVNAAQEGTLALTRWVSAVREIIRQYDGHDSFMTHQHRAAYTRCVDDKFSMLFVNAGLDASKSLEDQKDSFWMQPDLFDSMAQPYAPFQKVVRGFDPARRGMIATPVNVTLDAGCGFGGALACAQISAQGEFVQVLEV